MAAHELLPQGSREFIEGMGMYFAQFDLPRIFGRILGLLMISEHHAHTTRLPDCSMSRAARSRPIFGSP